VAIALATDLETAIKVSDEPSKNVDGHLEDLRTTHEIDEIGLRPLDYQYLEVLDSEKRPMGEQALANLIATADKDRIVDEVEPFLRKLGFIRFGTRGREITEKGSHYLLDLKKKSGSTLD
jgi:Holliday junction resolvasome RuvABC ATP-dependent DNA helicase subunit